MKINALKICSFALAVCISAAQLSEVVAAAPPEVVTDETAYLLLDYYGGLDNLSIVKGCDLNGVGSFSDYGDYSSVSNMSTLDSPEISDGKISWKLEESLPSRFYFEAVPQKQDMEDFPWSFDVGYKLNGVPKRAEELAGASGLVEVTVRATANPDADSYYRDNFMLMCAMLSDCGDNYSFAAPGAQFQSVGSYQMAFYMAMPKRDESFTFQIGSDCFETPGVIMMMMPATLSQLDDISDIKEHKQNLEDAGNATDDIVRDMLDIMGSMRGGLDETKQGLQKLEEARSAIEANRMAIKNSVSKLRASLKSLEKRCNDFGEALGDSKLADGISKMSVSMGSALTSMDNVSGELGEVSDMLVELKGYVQELNSGGLSAAGQENLLKKIRAVSLEIEDRLSVLESSTVQTYINTVNRSVQEIESAADEAVGAGDEILDSAKVTMVSELNTIARALSQMSQSSESLNSDIAESLKSVNSLSGEVEDLLEETSWTMDSLADMLKDTRGMLDAVDDTLEASSDNLSEGARLSLSGLVTLMDDVSAALQKTDNLQKNRQVISDIIRDEWHRLDDDFGILDIDTSAEKCSFTSAKNASPRTIQVVLRTAEIEVPDEEEESVRPDETANDIGPWGRIVNVFKKLFRIE